MIEKAFIYTVTDDERVIKKMNAVKMLSIMVGVLVGVTLSEGGYYRQNLPLGIPHPLTINREILQAQLRPGAIRYAVRDVPKKDISYTLSYEDYLYLKQHKVDGQDSPFELDPLKPEPNIDIKGTHKRNQNKYNIPCSDAVLKRSAATKLFNGYNIENAPVSTIVSDIVPVAPEVHKHVYFHVPPPDFEEAPLVPRIAEPKKKHVNILFIKVPSYERKEEYLQQLLQRQANRVEDKTLIYVLSKQESENHPQPVVLPSKPSPPEVYFIKYKTGNDIEPINNELSLPSLLQNVSPGLERRRAARDP